MLAWLDLTGCAFSLRPLYWFQYTSCPNFSQCNVTSKVLRFRWLICLDNSIANCDDHFSRNYPCRHTSSSYHIFHFSSFSSVHGSIIIFLWLFQCFSTVIHWCFSKCIFRIFFPKFLQHRFSSMYQSVLANFILNAFWNWGVIILLRLSVWFYLVTNDGYFWTLPNAEYRNGGTSSSDFPLFFFVTVF